MARETQQDVSPHLSDLKLSGIIRRLKRSKCLLLPLALFANYQADRGVCIQDEGESLLTPEEWAELKHEIDRFFSVTSHQEIYEHNLAINRRNMLPAPEFTAQITIPERLNSDGEGWVYLASAPSKAGVKIGATGRRLQIRLRQLSCEIRDEIICLEAFHTSQPFILEAALHKHFSAKLIEGEWFNLSAEDQSGLSDLVIQLSSDLKGGERCW